MKPLIVLTNDDGIQSPGLRAAAEAVMDLGELLIVAPQHQQSSVGRAFFGDRKLSRRVRYVIDGERIRAHSAPCSPAVAVRHALVLLASRNPALVISGINYGENIGNGVTISGTIGAALEAASLGAPALAVSVATERKYHLSYSAEIDFAAAAHFTRLFAEKILQAGMPAGADVLNVNVPANATAETAWRWARVSRGAYFYSTWKKIARGKRFTGYAARGEDANVETDSDIYALLVENLVSVAPLSLDLTARVDSKQLKKWDADPRTARKGRCKRGGTRK
ncbi:MAG: 5'/3'-nucleotidase SurE [Chloroflexi bacterium]|nr:5'/3'-nucleotidase SurE [Chloroflexota bacterium]